MLTINFVTTNNGKFAVAQHFFQKANLLGIVSLKQYSVETPEIQADSVEDVAINSAKWVANQLHEPVVVADAGLSIRALNGFPGPYMKYINQTLTPDNLIKAMLSAEHRDADFVDALAYFDPHTETTRVFKSITHGSIARQPAAVEGSTIDRLFLPEGHDITLAEMSHEVRISVWNTDRWQMLTEFLISQQ